MAAIQGGKFGHGALGGAIGSAAASAVGGSVKEGFWRDASQVVAAAFSGGAGSAISGGDFWQGFQYGAISATVNHLAHKITQEKPQQEEQDNPNKNKNSTANSDDIDELLAKYPEIEIGELGNQVIGGSGALELIGGPVVKGGGWLVKTLTKLFSGRNVSIIKGFTKHGINQAMTRGFTTKEIMNVVKHGAPVQAMGRYGPQTRYTLNNSTVVLNSQGKVVTVFRKVP